MLVLDYPRDMMWQSPVIVVPAFHAGHLGLVPGTNVNVALLTKNSSLGKGVERSNPEIVISQFEADIRPLAVLSVTLRDEAGVVERLTRAVSSLGINIELLESSSIEHLMEHHVTLLLSMPDESAPVPRNAPTLYDRYREILPVGDPGLVRLFEHVVLHCFDVIAWHVREGQWMPAIELRSLRRHTLAGRGFARIERAGHDRHIRLPEDVVGRLRAQMASPAAAASVSYIFISDTDQRNLRVFFMPSETRDRLFHLAFHHNNLPGALATILQLAAKARFNIVTSLLRKQTAERSVWEAVLEYRGEAEPPRSGGAVERIVQKELDWVAAQIHDCVADEVVEGVGCDIKLDVPGYPREGGVDRDSLTSVPIGDGLRFTGSVPFRAPANLVEQARSVLDVTQLDHLASIAELIDRIDRRVQGSSRPGLTRRTIFLSYPFRRAEDHAAILKARLEPHFVLTDYRIPDGEVIKDEVEKRIANADFFIGIWHHEEKPDGAGMYALSPWMPYEYGIARALGKPAIVLHSDKLPMEIWNRIDGGISQFEYSDLFFEKTVDRVVTYCKRRFRNV